MEKKEKKSVESEKLVSVCVLREREKVYEREGVAEIDGIEKKATDMDRIIQDPLSQGRTDRQQSLRQTDRQMQQHNCACVC